MTAQPLDQKMPLMAMPLQQEKDVVLCRNRARVVSGMLGFDKQQQVRIATAVSEIARNAFRYAREAAAEFAVVSRPAHLTDPAMQALLVTVKDQGPGMANLEAVLAGTYSSTTGMGMGIRGARRLMDSLDIHTGSQGTTVVMSHQLPRGARFTPALAQKITEELNTSMPASPMDELAVQNSELVQTIEELNVQQGELDKINEELSETNRGVVALYDELDTVYRVSRVVASKLDFESLINAITDATVDISGAEFGVFFYHDEEGSTLGCHAASGVLAPDLKGFSPSVIEALTAEMEGLSDALRVDDFAAERLGEPFGPENKIATTLSVAVRGSEGNLVGIMLFGHRTPNSFTERTERILGSVALQVSIGIENAMLYQSVRSASLAKDNFLAILSHELRTPLNPVFGILSALEGRKDLPTDVSQDLLVMRRNLELEARLIDDLLDLTRIVKGNISLQSKVIDMHELVQSVCRTCLSEIQRKGLNVELRLNARQFHVIGDPTRLQQVLWNLLNNAIKFTSESGRIVFQTSDDEAGRIVISLTDTGRGIDRESMERIFRPFEQGDPHVATQFGGLGLGLAISKAILDAHGGDISARSEGLNTGSTFVVTLPLTEKPAASETTAAPSTAATRLPGLSVLLVDDHEDTREIMSRLLELRGHSVVKADCCAAALERAAGQTFDLLISDLGLPDGSGHELIRELKAKYDLKGIALSGYGMESDLKRSEEAGFIAHLTKPVDLASLEAVIQKIFS